MCFQCFPSENSIGLTHQLVEHNYIQVKTMQDIQGFKNLGFTDTRQSTTQFPCNLINVLFHTLCMR